MKNIYLDLPFDLIQSIRLAHALMESEYRVCILNEHKEKFINIKKKFGIDYLTDDVYRGSGFLDVEALHPEPVTRIGSLRRSLVFPHVIFEYCRSIWANQRKISFCFAGLVSSNRKEALETWMKRNWPQTNVSLKNSDGLHTNALKTKFFQKLGIRTARVIKRQYGDVLFWSSERGRNFPFKTWDDEYFKLLANSKFVLCPNGDFIWSYRFFEAIMCGAIPVIESYTPVYEGFRFKTMEELVENMTWTKDDAEYNYSVCRERLTIPIEQLNAELEKLLPSI